MKKYKVNIAMPFSDDCEKIMYGSEILTENGLMAHQKVIEAVTGAKVDLLKGDYKPAEEAKSYDSDAYFLKQLLPKEGVSIKEVAMSEREGIIFGYSLANIVAEYYGWAEASELLNGEY